MELYAGSGGKVLLAFGPEELRRRILNKTKLRKMTANTIIDPGDLNKELVRIRAQGYALSAGERNPDAASLAVPIFNHDGKLVAALSLGGPLSRFTPESCPNLLKTLKDAGDRLSEALGYVPKSNN